MPYKKFDTTEELLLLLLPPLLLLLLEVAGLADVAT